MIELLLNDLSLHGQFPDIRTFRTAIHKMMLLRSLAANFGYELHSHRNMINSRITATASLYDVLQTFSQDEKRAILPWLTRLGPFWEDTAEHGSDQWMDCGNEIVTETAVGEAAYCQFIGLSRALVSFTPSRWEYAPITVRIVSGSATDVVNVPNYWQAVQLEATLREAAPPIASWAQLESVSRSIFQRLTFTTDCFSYLKGQPFAPGPAKRIQSRLWVLDQFIGSIDSSGQRTAHGHQLYQNHFTGDKAWFSDSSDSEKHEFAEDLTFPNPQSTGEYLLCSWHGKINHPPFRIHFAWPDAPGAPLYVVYVGLKITRH